MMPTVKRFLTPTEILKASFDAKRKQDMEYLKSVNENYINLFDDTIIKEFYNAKELVNKQKTNYLNFSNSVKTTLLTECIYKIYNGSLNLVDPIYEKCIDSRIKYAYVTNFIQENGMTTILNEFKTKTSLLSEFNNIVNKYYKIIMEKVDEKDSTTFKIDDEDKESFLDELDNEEVDDIIEVIKDRVQDAVEVFIKNNSDDKEKIKDIIDNTQAKIDASSDDKIAESHNMLGKRRINDIKNSRPQTVLEVMVKAISKSAMTDKSLNESFTDSNNKLDMESILESSIAMYTFLETLNTAKITKVDSKYIESIYDSLNS